MAVTVEQLVEGAERTIAAAAAAIVWTGDDGHGVLAHVAAANPQLMAMTRLTYECRVPEKPVPLQIRRRLEQLFQHATGFEVAALPSTVASPWTKRVIAAFLAHCNDSPAMPRSGAARDAFLMRDAAFHACRMWGEDPLRMDRVLFWANDAQIRADRCWRSEWQV